MKNRRIVVTRPGGPEVLQLVEEDLPEPAADQGRVKVLAAGVAYADIGVRLGTYPGADVSSGRVSPGYDIVGLVDKPGPEITRWKPGQGVAALTVTGGYAEYVCLPASELIAVPEGVDPAEAVSLVLNYSSKRLAAYFIARFKAEHPDWFRTDLETLFWLLVEKKIEPVIAERIPLTEARRAHELLDKAAVSGKIVLVV